MTTPDLRDSTTQQGVPLEPDDLGFGRFVADAVRGRFINRDGTPTSRKFGIGAQRAERFYLGALIASWPTFLSWLVGTVLLINGVFALGYRALGSAALAGISVLGLDDPFLSAFAYSVGVFTSTGTDGVHAVGTTAHWLVIIESIIGAVFFVIATGLMIARLTRPRMRLKFSESAVVAPYREGRGLMFRMVNPHPGEISDVRVRVTLIWFQDVDGKRERRFQDLQLERDTVEFFTLHWTVVHPINAKKRSPLLGITPEALSSAEAEFVISVNAHEESFSTRVRTRTSYTWEEIDWDAKFANIFTSAGSGDGVVAIDVERLSRIERLEEGSTTRPAEAEVVGPVAQALQTEQAAEQAAVESLNNS